MHVFASHLLSFVVGKNIFFVEDINHVVWIFLIDLEWFTPHKNSKYCSTLLNSLAYMEVICLQTEAFYALVEEVYERLKDQDKPQDKWVDSDEAMLLLKIKSKTTLQKLRNEGRIRFSQPQKRIIIYDRGSIEEYLQKHSKDTF